MIALVAIGVVVVVVAVFIVIKATSSGSKPTATAREPVPASLYRKFTDVSVATLAAAAKHYAGDEIAYPEVTNDAALTKTGKPEALYIGAEYCPYCATERWPLVLALSKFGTFTGLHFLHSDNEATEEYRRVPTFSFYESHYTSPYLKFVSVEEYTVSGQPLQTLTKAQEALDVKYADGIPFVYMNGKAIVNARPFDPGLLVGNSYAQVVNSVSGGTSALADNIYKAAGVIVSDLCRMTGGKPADVCKLFPKPITST